MSDLVVFNYTISGVAVYPYQRAFGAGDTLDVTWTATPASGLASQHHCLISVWALSELGLGERAVTGQ